MANLLKIWIKDKSMYTGHCTAKRLVWSEVFCFYKGSTEMMHPAELNCAECLPRTLAQEIALVKSDASSSSAPHHHRLFSFLFLTNILPSFMKCSMVLKQNHSKNLRVLYCFFISDEWERKTSNYSRSPLHTTFT